MLSNILLVLPLVNFFKKMFTGSHDEMKAGPSFSITEKIEDFIRPWLERQTRRNTPTLSIPAMGGDVGRQLLLF